METSKEFDVLTPAEEQHWLGRFLRRELDAETADAFEAYALDKPHLLAQMEADQVLGHVMNQMAAKGDLPLPPASARPLWRRSPHWGLALAAGVLAGVVAGYLLRTPEATAPLHWVSPERLVIETMRGAEQLRSMQSQAGALTGVVIVDVVLPPLAELTAARLTGPAGDIALPSARADLDGVLSLVLDRRLLPGAELVLALRGPDGPFEQRVALEQTGRAR